MIKLQYLNVLDEVLLNVLLELGRHEGLGGALPHLGVGHDQGQQGGHVGHQALQQGQGHCQEQRPWAHLEKGKHEMKTMEIERERKK